LTRINPSPGWSAALVIDQPSVQDLVRIVTASVGAVSTRRQRRIALTSVNAVQPGHAEDHGPKYFVDIEGTEHLWARATITVSEIRTLGGIAPDVPVLEIDPDNNQRQLAEDEIIELKPGHGYSKKIKYGRGNE
jgi:hypothetical protein